MMDEKKPNQWEKNHEFENDQSFSDSFNQHQSYFTKETSAVDETPQTFAQKVIRMEENYHEPKQDATTIESNVNHNKKKPSRRLWRTVASNVSIGVISSLLTLTMASYFGDPLAHHNEIGSNDQYQSETLNVTATPTSTAFRNTEAKSIADIAEQLTPTIVGVVNIQKYQNSWTMQNESRETGAGSGVIFKKDERYGYIVTNNHVIEGANEVEISLYNGKTIKAEIVGADALTDLAVLRIDAKLVDRVASFGDSSKVRPGDEVIAIGNPLGLDFSRTVTRGIISATNRTISVKTSAGEWELDVIQTDAAINPGNSGGALINSQGEVIGINSLKIAETGVEGLGFAIPSNDVRTIIDQLIKNGSIKRPYIGVQLFNVSDMAKFYRQNVFGAIEKGIVVANVEPQSPADKAALRVNDVIVSINGNEVSTVSDFRKYLYRHVKPGDTIKIQYYRDGKKHTVAIKTAENK